MVTPPPLAAVKTPRVAVAPFAVAPVVDAHLLEQAIRLLLVACPECTARATVDGVWINGNAVDGFGFLNVHGFPFDA